MRIWFTFFLCALSLNASLLLEKIENLVGKNTYSTHKNLIALIFNDQNKFYLANGTPDYVKIFKELKSNGLLNLKLISPQEIEVEFHTTNNPIKSLKILNDTLKSIGYYYYFTKNIKRNFDGSLIWTISLQTEFIIDPLILIPEISKNSSKVLDVSQVENNKWIYKIDTSFANIAEAISINVNENKKLQKPLSAYMIQIQQGTIIEIKAHNLDKWFADIAFFDSNLNVLDVTRNEEAMKIIALEIPQGTKYIKISDLHSLENIKRGLEIIIKNKEDNDVPRN